MASPERLRSLSGDLERLLTLLLQWNAKMNLTAIRDPESIVERHFGESLFLAFRLPKFQSLLDFGSGAGFPGLPIQLLHQETHVTLAESQRKKATFLREAVRQLMLPSVVLEERLASPAQFFDVITLRAVDKMDRAFATATEMKPQSIYVLSSTAIHSRLIIGSPLRGFKLANDWKVPQSSSRRLLHFRASVPRETSP